MSIIGVRGINRVRLRRFEIRITLFFICLLEIKCYNFLIVQIAQDEWAQVVKLQANIEKSKLRYVIF